MKKQALSWLSAWLSIVAVLGISLAAAAGAAAPQRSDGLVPMDSRSLDEVYLRPDTNFQGYHKVMIDPGTVEMRKGWLKSINATRGPSRWLVPEDVQNITDNAATSLSTVMAATFKAKGYEVVTTPGAGVLRVTPRITDLVVNAPSATSAYMQALYNIDAGEATLTMDVRDAATGALLGQFVDRRTAHELSPRINRSLGGSNSFWFDALFARWTTNCIAGLESPGLSN